MQDAQRKNSVGVLLIHGFTGSPNELSDLGEFLKKNSVTVSIPTLPGHATYSGDMFNYTWRDWVDCVRAEYDRLANVCREVFVGGLSMGGALALHLAAHRPVTGIISLAAPVHFPAWQRQAVKYIKGLLKFRQKRSGEDVADVTTREWLGSYRRYPYYAVEQLHRLIDHIRGDLVEIEQPILIIHSRKDHTIPFANSQTIFEAVRSKGKRKIDLEESFHVITVDVEKEVVCNEIMKFIREYSSLTDAVGTKKSKKKSERKTADTEKRGKSQKGFL